MSEVVLVITPIPLYGDGIARFLGDAGFDVAEVCDNGEAGVAAAARHRPLVILLDMAVGDSFGAVRALSTAVPDSAIVALALPESERRVIECAEAGLVGYVSREASLERLLDSVRSAATGETLCSPRIAAGLFRRLATLAVHPPPPPAGRPPGRALTAREAEVMRLIKAGLSNKEIAYRLCISLPTVKNHVHSILDKVGAHSRTEAAALTRDRFAGLAEN